MGLKKQHLKRFLTWFRQKNSTTAAKVNFVESNINLIDRGKSVVGIFTSNITLKIISAINVEISHGSEKS